MTTLPVPSLRLLGEIDLRAASGERVSRVLQQPKRLALLAYLAVQGERYTPRSELLDRFWADQPEDRARNALSQALHHLREHLGAELLELQGADALRLAPGRLRCDVTEFLSAARTAAPGEALTLYRGELLPGFIHDFGRTFTWWLDETRGALGRTALDLALAAVAVAQTAQEPAAAWEAARRAQELAPDDEAAMRAVLETALPAGQGPVAVERYGAWERRLRAELEETPSERTVQLAAALEAALREEVPAPGNHGQSARASAPVDAPTPAAAGLVAAGSAEPTPVPSTSRQPTARFAMRRRGVVVGALVVVAAAVALLALRRTPRAPGLGARSSQRLLVAEFDNPARRADLAPLGTIAQDWITGRLVRGGDSLVVDAPTALWIWRRATPSPAGLAAMSAQERVGLLLRGSVIPDGATVIVRAELVELPSLRMLASLPSARAATVAPLPAIDSVADAAFIEVARLRNPTVASALPPSDRLPSLPAYVAFAKGIDLFVQRNMGAAFSELRRAATLDTSFTAAALYTALAASGDSTGVADSILSRLIARKDQLPEQMRLRAEALDAFRRGDEATGDFLMTEVSRRFPSELSAYLAALSRMRQWQPRSAADQLARLDPTRGWLGGWHTYWTARCIALHLASAYAEERRCAAASRAQYPRALSALTNAIRVHATVGEVAAVDSLVTEAIRLNATADWGWTAAQPMAIAAGELRVHGYRAAADSVTARLRRWVSAQGADPRLEAGDYPVGFQLYVAGDFAAARPRCPTDLSLRTLGWRVRSACTLLELLRGTPTGRAMRDTITTRLRHSAVWRARVAAAAGDATTAAAALREARRDRVGYDYYLHIDPIFTPFLADSGFAALLRPE